MYWLRWHYHVKDVEGALLPLRTFCFKSVMNWTELNRTKLNQNIHGTALLRLFKAVLSKLVNNRHEVNVRLIVDSIDLPNSNSTSYIQKVIMQNLTDIEVQCSWVYFTPQTRDGVLEDCPRARGQLEDPKSWPRPWPLSGLALALGSMHRPPVTGL